MAQEGIPLLCLVTVYGYCDPASGSTMSVMTVNDLAEPGRVL